MTDESDVRGREVRGRDDGDRDDAGRDQGACTEKSQLVIWVTGQVQGVGFRWWVREQASALGLGGSASNLEDGSVEIVLEGTRSDCAEVLAKVQRGGAPGRVESAVHRWGPRTGATTFTVS